MSRSIVLVLLLALAVLAAGCSGAAPGPVTGGGQGTYPLTITDDAGRVVTIDKEPQRLVSLSASNTELVYAVGLQGKLVGVDEYSDYPAEAKRLEKVGGFSKPNYEKIVSLAPDLVLATNIHVKAVLPELEKRGLRVVVIQPPKLDNVVDNLVLLGKIGGNAALANEVADGVRSRIEAVTGKTNGLPPSQRVRVFFELDPGLITTGPDTFLDDMITKAGGENIARDAKSAWPQLSPEAVVLKDPQVIILSDHGSDAGGVTPEIVKARPGWSTISAVQANRIVELPDRDLTDRPGPRAVEGLEFLARTLHPELFPATR